MPDLPERFYGLLPTTPDPRDYRLTPPRRYDGAFVDNSPGLVRILDQGRLGSCVPHGVTYAIEYVLAKQGAGTTFAPSRLFIYYNGRVIGHYPLNQDTGLQIRDGVHSAVTYGAPPETAWPYDISRFTTRPPDADFTEGLKHQVLKYAQVATGDLDDAIASGYLVLSGFDVYESFEGDDVANTGIMPEPNRSREQLLGGHCTDYASTAIDGAKIPGKYQGKSGLKYRLKPNSWGPKWGLGGFYWEPVTVQEQDASDFWVITGVEDEAVNPPQPPPPADPDPAFAAVLRPRVSSVRPASVKHAAETWLAAKGL